MGKTSSASYNINYHLVWCPKYRKPILEKPEVKQFLEEQIHTIAATKGFEVLALEVMPDHIHLFVSAPPFDSPTEIVKVFKGVTALRLFKKFPELRNQFWKGKLWSPSYYVGTAGHVSAETIRRYIEEQTTQKHNSSSQQVERSSC
jgi:putative transposase